MRLYIAPLIFALGAQALVTPQSNRVARDVSLQASNKPISRRNAFFKTSSAAALIVSPILPYAAVADEGADAPKPPPPAPAPAPAPKPPPPPPAPPAPAPKPPAPAPPAPAPAPKPPAPAPAPAPAPKPPAPAPAPKPPAPAPTPASSGKDTASIVSVSEWPSLEYLEPIYEFKLAVDSFQAAAKDKTKWPYLKILLDKFFSGGLYSEKNYYSGLSFKYMQYIKYDQTELKEFIKLDQNERYEAMEATMKHLEDLKDNLGKGNADKITANAEAARKSMAAWFALVPSSDVKAVEKLFRSVRLADKDRNGRLSDEELATLSAGDRDIWKKRVNSFGEA